MIIGTAGHIDHGKSSLVQALTGIAMDRLKEEQRRGITIDLNFAHMKLDDGSVASIVDVPGHERFVREMVAGAGGLDAAILVIACDEGVMPQTREHLDICRLLGLRGGVVALTKSDVLKELGEDWLPLLEGEVKALVKGTFLEGAKVVPCSARTGEGLPELKAELSKLKRELPTRSADGPLLLPVDRSFAVKGFGCVVTGSLSSGRLSVDEEVSIQPKLAGPWRVRGLQSHGSQAQSVSAGQRVAVNLASVSPDDVPRGAVICRFGEVQASKRLDVELSLLAAAEKALPIRSKFLLHAGTAQVQAQVTLIDRTELLPGETCFAQVKLETPLATLFDQHFILRGFKTLPGRGTTVAGGRILAASRTRRRKGAAERLSKLAAGDAEARILFHLEEAGFEGLSFAELFARTSSPPKPLQKALDVLGAKRTVLLADRDKRQYLSGALFQRLVERARAEVDRFHAREPMRDGIGKEELRSKLSETLPQKIFQLVVAELLAGGEFVAEGESVRRKSHGRTATVDAGEARGKILEAIRNAGLAPPRVAELRDALKLPEKTVIDLCRVLVDEKLIHKLNDELYVSKEAVDGLKEKLVAHLGQHGEITTPVFKDLVGQSRKFVIPFAEFFDREKVTLRVGEKRVLRKR